KVTLRSWPGRVRSTTPFPVPRALGRLSEACLPPLRLQNISYRLDLRRRREIDPHIYGVNWPKNANYIRTLGVTFSRWGGNAVTAYNPFEHFTNAGSDWFFENRGNEKSDDWIG